MTTTWSTRSQYQYIYITNTTTIGISINNKTKIIRTLVYVVALKRTRPVLALRPFP